MILDYLAPGARRRTHTAGTTEASLLGLLDVENHILRVQKGAFEVNCYLATVCALQGQPVAFLSRRRGLLLYLAASSCDFLLDGEAPCDFPAV